MPISVFPGRRSGAVALVIVASAFLARPAAAHGEAAEPEREERGPKAAEGPPEELPFVADQPPPKGYHLDRRPNETALGLGIVLFAGSWLPGLGLSVACQVSDCRGSRHGWETALVVPVGGPVAYAIGRCAGDHAEPCYLGTLVWLADAAVQAGGLALTILGARKRPVWVRDSIAISLAPLPMFRAGRGLSLVGRF